MGCNLETPDQAVGDEQAAGLELSATIQRLGYILEFVLEEKEKADEMYQQLKAYSPRWKKVLPSNWEAENGDAQANRWHVNPNIEIEIDEI